jgi:CBS-domain-containing membrane protein
VHFSGSELLPLSSLILYRNRKYIPDRFFWCIKRSYLRSIQSPLAQPRNLVGGHVLSALVGLRFIKLFRILSGSAPLAVAFSIVLMQYTKTLHPPGATALIAVSSTGKFRNWDIGMLSPSSFGVYYPVACGFIFQ